MAGGHAQGRQAPLRISGPVSAHGLARQLRPRRQLSPRRWEMQVLGETRVFASLVQCAHRSLTLWTASCFSCVFSC